MATITNIRIRQHNGTDYDYLYPETIGSQVLLQNYIKAGSLSAIAELDNLNVAIGKLEKRIENRKTTCRYVIGISTAGWTANDCDYLCDGTSDEVEINAAISALPSSGGEIVILDGTYNLTASIFIDKDYVTVRGNGSAAILKRGWNATAIPQALLSVPYAHYGTKIYNLQINGNNNIYTDSKNFGIYMSAAYFGSVCNNLICCCAGNGIYLYNSQLCTINNNYCEANGISIVISNSNSISVSNNQCAVNSYSGVSLNTVSNCTLIGNNFWGGNYGINISTGCYCAINNNTLSYCSQAGITATSQTKGNAINSNTFSNMELYGIKLQDSDHNSVIGNSFNASSYTSGQQTIYLYTTSNDYNMIAGNNCYGKAPFSDGGTGNTLINNIS